jgi:nucleoside-diphosphate-sugar epimerase
MTRIAVLGIGGFVGARLLESYVLDPGRFSGVELVPVIRQPRGIGRSSKLGFAILRSADAADRLSLAKVFQGCDAVINLTAGNNERILPDLQNIHAACHEAGVGRLVHLSTAEVFGRCDTPGLDDDSPWFRNHWMAYARAKGRAEDWTRTCNTGPAVVVLRPGLIWGPRSPWVAGPAETLASRTTWLVDEGRWACNLCHVDNMVHYLLLAARPGGAAGFFNVGDPDRPSWREYYEALAGELGRKDFQPFTFAETDFRVGIADRLLALRETSPAQALKRGLSSATKEKLKHHLARLSRRRANGERSGHPRMERSLWWLQTTRYHLPVGKFHAAFKPAGALGFGEGMVGTGEWLRFSGYAD